MGSRKRGATGLSGVLLVDKPAGLTSHDVVARIRRATGEGRVGHAGTLDPLATGLLVVLVGPATRLEPYLSSAEKRYTVCIAFGSATDTDDSQGAIVREAPVAPEVSREAYAHEILASFTGELMQQPPAYSAIKVGGTTAHRAARAGEAIELADRQVTVYRADLLGIESEPVSWDVAFDVSKGTYIRSLARDIGVATGGAAHLTVLRRTASGPLLIEDARDLEAVVDAAGAGELPLLWADPVEALGLAVVAVDPVSIADGRGIDASQRPDVRGDERVAVVDAAGGGLLAVYRRSGDRLVAEAVFPGGISKGRL